MKRSVRILWQVFFAGLTLFILLILSLYFNWFGNMPPESVYENPSSNLSSEVYAADGTLLGRYYVQDRSTSKYHEISPHVLQALVATEDERFYDHSGIDGKAIIRAVLLLGRQGGGSTITQQLAKNLFGRQRPSMYTMPLIKLKEWVMAVKLERNLTKKEIITLYLNTVPFGDNVYGIKNAALTFYNKMPDKLSADEAAVLIGMLKANTYYNPRLHPDRAEGRRNVVLDQMVKAGYLNSAEAAKLKRLPIKLDYHKIDYHEGIAPYFRQVVEQQVKKALKETHNPATGKPYDIYKDGLRIYTTLDTRMQRYAEQAVEQHMSELQRQFIAQAGYKDGRVWRNHMDVVYAAMKATERYYLLKESGMEEEEILKVFNTPVKMKVFAWNSDKRKDTTMSPMDSIMYMKMFLQAGFMAMDPYSGEVRAWVGGINHDYYQFDHVNINTKRQVGSTIKPLLYCLAIDNGFSPCGMVSTEPQIFDGKPYDAGGSKHGTVTMQRALALSLNNAALYILKQVGVNAFVDFAGKCGITSKIEKYPSSALGVSDISLYEMLGAYTMFPAAGMHTKPLFITRIEDKNGNLVRSFVAEQKEIISAGTAFKMVKMMRGVVDHGTARRLRYRFGLTGEMAGKTGTTNNQADAWFIGYTPQLLAGAWVGCDDRFLRFRSEALGQGAAAALPIWGHFITKVYADKSLELDATMTFQEPEGFDDCNVIDSTSLLRANSYYGSEPADEQAPQIPVEEWSRSR
jgi:penicillin-binding protein 1A